MNGKIELELNGIRVMVLGGPYREKPGGIKGVKLAPEITVPAEVVLDIADFSTPSVKDTVKALKETFTILRDDSIVYVGCWGGIGRTGMFMALIALVAAVDRMIYPPKRSAFGQMLASFFCYSTFKPEPQWCKDVRNDPIKYIRSVYISEAVETEDQRKFVALFPVMEKLVEISPKGVNPFSNNK